MSSPLQDPSTSSPSQSLFLVVGFFKKVDVFILKPNNSQVLKEKTEKKGESKQRERGRAEETEKGRGK